MTAKQEAEPPPTLTERMRVEWPVVLTLLVATASYVHTQATLGTKLDTLIKAVDKLVQDVANHEGRVTRLEAVR